MSDKLGPILYGSESSSDEVFLGRDFNHTKNYSEETASIIDAEVKDIVLKAYEDAKKILEENMEKLHFVASYLMKNEIMEEAQFVRAMSEPDITLEALEEMVAEKRRRSREENEAHARRIAELEKQREEERAKEKEAENRRNPQNRDAEPFQFPFPTAPKDDDGDPDDKNSGDSDDNE